MNDSNINKMIKNKDGSYNIFRITLISLIFIIGISIMGVYINQNVELPQIEVPQFIKPIPTPTPVPTPTLFQTSNEQLPPHSYSNWSMQFNESQFPTSWNWSYTNYSHINTSYETYSNWTYPQNINYTMYTGGNGGIMYVSINTTNMTGYGGQGGYGYYNATTYLIVAGGGGSGSGGSSGSIDDVGIYHPHPELTVTPTPTQTLESNMTLILSPFFQDPSNNLLWIILPITTFMFMMTMVGTRSMSMIPILLVTSLMGVFLFHSWFMTLTSVVICIFIISFDFVNSNRDI